MQFQDTLTRMLDACVPPAVDWHSTPLAGDASSRRYFRLHRISQPDQTLVLMVMDPTRSLVSEEGGSGRVPPELPFANIQRFLHGMDWPVPAILDYRPEAGLLLLEDFGDVTLEAWLANRSDAAVLDRYKEAVTLLVDLQVKGGRLLTDACWAAQEHFDRALLRWEFEHFYEYAVVAAGGEPSAAARGLIQASFDQLSDRIAAFPYSLVHRDYHSRNLMVTEKGLGVIDFQDALMGPRHYDLASLLRDSYVDLPESSVSALLEHYLMAYREAGGEPREIDPALFREEFDIMCLQRNMKAAGRFVFIDKVKGNPKFLQYIPRTLDNIRRNLERYPAFEALQAALGESVPALRPR